jgi:hypothetical protein
MSEVYRPHAWPDNYQQAIEYDVVGMGVFGQSIVACTNAAPFIGVGVNPASITLRTSSSVEPCLSRQSIATTIYGVLYASSNGLVLVNGPNPSIVTKQLLSKYEWQDEYNPDNIRASSYHNQYIAFFGDTQGFIFDPNEPMSAFIEISNDLPVVGVQTNTHTGEILLFTGTALYNWDAESAAPLTYTWRSKEYVTPTPINLGAARITFEGVDSDLGVVSSDEQTYNNVRIASPLNTIGGTAVAGDAAPIDTGTGLPDNRLSLAGSPLFDIDTTSVSPDVIFRVYVIIEGTEYLKFEGTVNTTENLIRLPSSFRATRWMFEVEGQRPIQSIKAASTARELRNV